MKKLLLACLMSYAFFATPMQVINAESDDFSYPYLDDEAEISDPLEPLNRVIYGFNRALDSLIITPVASLYKAVTPPPVRRSVGNFMNNFQEPVRFVNAILVADPKGAMDATSRFLVNTSLGIGGLIDVASASEKLPTTKHFSFNNTLKHYGAKRGIYLVLPLMGPSDLRGAVGFVADNAGNPLNYVFHKDYYFVKSGISFIDAKARVQSLEKHIRKDAIDEYVSYRSYYNQISQQKRVGDE